MKFKEKLVIIHFQPVELYPPIQNLLLILKDVVDQGEVIVISTVQSNLPEFELNSKSMIVFRKNIISKYKLVRFIRHIYFYIFTFLKLLYYRPNKVLYFESLSSFPAICYKFLFSKIQLMVHYHEYTTPKEYEVGMQILKWSYLFERRYYHNFDWISHTNEKRLELFKNDNKIINNARFHVMPNYPLRNWMEASTYKRDLLDDKIKFIYVGPLNSEDTYILEFCNFIGSNERYELLIFSQRVPQDFKDYLKLNKISNIQIGGTISYNYLPCYLKSCHIGIILYKCNTLNQRFAAPNKLFEYLACGLDVWFPKEMEGCYEYKSNVNPKVIEVNFDNIEESIKNYSYSIDGREKSTNGYVAEEACSELIKMISN
jgi:hypothetical protein